MINYKQIEKLHESVQGSVVLKVKNTDTGEICVLKLIGQLSDKLNKLIFTREVAALRKLNQFDDVVKIYDSSNRLRYKKQSGYGAILLELVDGHPLNTVDFSGFSDLDKVTICKNSAMATLHAHQCGILHRDIKPSNIMLDESTNKIKMIDFGSSKLKAIVDEETTHWVFTPGFVAPEVANGHESTEKSDIYSLGAVFYYIFLGEVPIREHVSQTLESSAILPEMRKLLLRMLTLSPDDRIDEMQDVLNILEDIIGNLNTSAYNYWFYVDSGKLDDLKRSYTVERTMTFQQLLSAYLPHEFDTMHGSYHKNYGVYEFVGKSLFMQCTYDTDKRLFNVVKLYEIPIDRCSKLRSFFGLIEGKRNFIGFGTPTSGRNSNNKLKVQLHNHAEERDSLDSKNRLFEELFGKWRDSITESLESIKDKLVQIDYDDYWFEQGRLSLLMKSIRGIEIDSLTEDNHFLFDAPDSSDHRTIPIGYFEDYYLEDEDSVLVLSLDRNASQGKLIPLLDANTTILENYRRHTVSYRRQLAAISALKNDEYNTTGLKDIILELSEPTSTHSIQSLKYYDTELNDSQKQAIKKAIYSNNISLIQGPPGTGKTSVIAELIHQIIDKEAQSDILPKILIVSQSHTAVDNILERVMHFNHSQKQRIVRIGKKEDVSDSVASLYMIDAIRDDILTNVRTSSTHYIGERIKMLSQSDIDDKKAAESKEASLRTWLNVKELNEDWLLRCGDYSSLRYQIVNTATIIAGTCIGFLSDENVREMTFDFVIVDEAAKATTPELLVSIVKAKKIVLVGDQNQLPAFADSSLSELAVELVKDPKHRIFDILYDSLPDSHKQFLTTQYRMCSTIGNLISTVFYDGKIITGVDDKDRQHGISRFAGKAIVWIDTSRLPNHGSNGVPGGSSYNISEVRIVRELLNYINRQENAKSLDVGIITGYRAQKDSLNKTYKNGDYGNIGNVDINTLDAFQGRENDIIVYSTVRTSGNIVFLQERERVNVAFSRARRLLIICGDLCFFESWTGSPNTFIEIVQYLRSNPDVCQILDAREVLK